MNKFIYNIKHIMQSKTILALLTVVGMIGTCTNVVVASAAPNVKQNVKTRKVNLYIERQVDEIKTSVDIPVGATNLQAARIMVAALSNHIEDGTELLVGEDGEFVEKDGEYVKVVVCKYFYLPEFQSKIYPIVTISDTGECTCNFKFVDSKLANNTFRFSEKNDVDTKVKLVRTEIIDGKCSRFS